MTPSQAYDIEDFLRKRGYASPLTINAVVTHYDVLDEYFAEYGEAQIERISDLEEEVSDLQDEVNENENKILALEVERDALLAKLEKEEKK